MEAKDSGFSDFRQTVPYYQSSDSSDAECKVHCYLHTNITQMLTRPQTKWHLVCFLLLCPFIPLKKWLTSFNQNRAFIISVMLIHIYLIIFNFCIFNKNSTNTVMLCPLTSHIISVSYSCHKQSPQCKAPQILDAKSPRPGSYIMLWHCGSLQCALTASFLFANPWWTCTVLLNRLLAQCHKQTLQLPTSV
jgi:hypothetical protein